MMIEYMVRPRIICEDGASISIQAGRHCYSSPRQDHGPYTHVEVGFPSHPFPEAEEYKEDKSVDDSETVFAYVPIHLVEEWIVKHGGVKEMLYKNNDVLFE